MYATSSKRTMNAWGHTMDSRAARIHPRLGAAIAASLITVFATPVAMETMRRATTHDAPLAAELEAGAQLISGWRSIEAPSRAFADRRIWADDEFAESHETAPGLPESTISGVADRVEFWF